MLSRQHVDMGKAYRLYKPRCSIQQTATTTYILPGVCCTEFYEGLKMKIEIHGNQADEYTESDFFWNENELPHEVEIKKRNRYLGIKKDNIAVITFHKTIDKEEINDFFTRIKQKFNTAKYIKSS